MATRPNLIHFLHTNPIFDMEQAQRYSSMVNLSDQLSKLLKQVKHYHSLGLQTTTAFADLCNGFQHIDVVCANSQFSEILNTMQSFQSSLTQHFNQVENNIFQPLRLFMKNDIDSLILSQKSYLSFYEKFANAQEKYLARAKDRKKYTVLVDTHKNSAKAFYEYVKYMDIAEASFNGIINNVLTMFNNSIAHVAHSLSGVKTISESKPPEIFDRCVFEHELLQLDEIVPQYWKEQELPPTEEVTTLQKQGFLWKKTGRIAATWERRFFVVTNGTISASHTPELAHHPSWTLSLLFAHVRPIEDRSFTFSLITKDRQLVLQASSRRDMDEWMAVINNSIVSLMETGEESIDPMLIKPKSPYICADCGAPDATWLVCNKGCIVCDQCAGCHRGLPPSVSKIRSITLDSIDPVFEEILHTIGNDIVNAILDPRPVQRLAPDSPIEVREDFIRHKYLEQSFMSQELPHVDIFTAIKHQDFIQVMQAIFMNFVQDARDDDELTPLHVAAIIGNPLSVALIQTNTTLLDELVNNWSPLSYASYFGQILVCDYLLSAGANPDSAPLAHPYLIACQQKNEDLMQKFSMWQNGAKSDPHISIQPPYLSYQPQEFDKEPFIHRSLSNFNSSLLMSNDEKTEIRRVLASIGKKTGRQLRKSAFPQPIYFDQ